MHVCTTCMFVPHHCASLYHVHVCASSLCMFVPRACLCHIIVHVCTTCMFVSHHCARLCHTIVQVCATVPSIPCSAGLIPFANIFIQIVLLKIEMCRNTLSTGRVTAVGVPKIEAVCLTTRLPPVLISVKTPPPPAPDNPPLPPKKRRRSLAMLIIRGK